MITEKLTKIISGQDLSLAEARAAMEYIMGGEATPAQIAAFITALRMKGETVDEITGCAQAMRAMATPLAIKGKSVALETDGANQAEELIVDTCGTGGDKANTFNISTAVAFVAAGQGLTVAKHGNRAISSKCGSADVLERLGVSLQLSPDQVKRCVDQVGIGFLFAPVYHLAMKHAAGPRREIGIRTIFNLLGPLANPAGANVQVLGVYDPKLTETMAKVLGQLGIKRAMVVHGHGTLDEISLTGSSRISEWSNGKVKTYEVNPKDFGVSTARSEELAGGDAEQNAAIFRSVFSGDPGPKLDAVLVNASAVFVASGLAKDFKTGADLAREVISSGKAQVKLDDLVKLSGELAKERK